ncbi:recombinase RecT [Streptomyces sp. V3I7]|uniref:recombinase RecT n=1 Tax=Streptomyces sp. V3I7 TaxID=3042278 RepID=UPI002782279C|nr:recombinase RecT [Streptomyces sp. V3I7]MDQ0990702.1 phage recombination protein Bet [Streptomyces sp. V3I7]
MTDEPSAEPAIVEGTVVETLPASTSAAAQSAVVLRADQTEFDARQVAALSLISPGLAKAPRAQLAIFFHFCVRSGLDPFARQIYMIGRKNWKAADDPDEPERTWTIQTGIDGFRTIAHRAAAKAGESISYEDTVYYDSEGNAHDVWLSRQYPAAVKVTVLRGTARFPFIARWDEFAPTYYDPKEGAYVVAKMWRQMPAHMIRKCGEAGSLRMAAPQDLSGVYVDEEMARADADAVVCEAEDATRRLRAAAGLEAGDDSGDSTKDEPGAPAAEDRDAEAAKHPARKRTRAAKKTAPAEQPAPAAESDEAPAPAKRKPRKAAASRRAAS